MSRNKKGRADGLVYSTDPGFRPEDEFREEDTPPPASQRLKVVTDSRHRAGKLVTLVLGFRGRSADLELLGKKLKTHCGTGGSVKNGEIIIQGDQREKVMAWLKKEGWGSRQ